MRNAEELFNDYIDFDTCTYTNEELKKDAILAMEAYAKEYHESKVKTLALPVVNNSEAVVCNAMALGKVPYCSRYKKTFPNCDECKFKQTDC